MIVYVNFHCWTNKFYFKINPLATQFHYVKIDHEFVTFFCNDEVKDFEHCTVWITQFDKPK